MGKRTFLFFFVIRCLLKEKGNIKGCITLIVQDCFFLLNPFPKGECALPGDKRGIAEAIFLRGKSCCIPCLSISKIQGTFQLLKFSYFCNFQTRELPCHERSQLFIHRFGFPFLSIDLMTLSDFSTDVEEAYQKVCFVTSRSCSPQLE